MFRSEPPQIFTFSSIADSNTWHCIVEINFISWHCSTLLRWWRFLTRDRWLSLTLLLTLVLSPWMEIIVRDMEEEDWQYSSWVCSSISSCKILFPMFREDISLVGPRQGDGSVFWRFHDDRIWFIFSDCSWGEVEYWDDISTFIWHNLLQTSND